MRRLTTVLSVLNSNLIYIALGANLGDREATILTALSCLDKQVGCRLAVAPLYYSEPWGFVTEHPFCNTVAAYITRLTPNRVLDITQAIERQLGRLTKTRSQDGKALYSDRLIDIDLIRAFDRQGREITLDTPSLTLPHPLYRQRPFVTVPMAQLIPFIKMHGIGNDYIYLDCTTPDAPALSLLAHPADYAPLLCDRHKGIGADGLVFILSDEQADLRMRIFNADGSEAEMCGNAARCVGKYVVESGLVPPIFALATGAGIRKISVNDDMQVTVDMGEPHYLDSLTIGGRQYHCVSVGNPHAVTLLSDDEPDLTTEQVQQIGSAVEHDSHFTERTNVEFVRVLDPHHIRLRVWERGSGETQACGTGATAAAFACVRQGLCGYPVTVALLGGELTVNEITNTQTSHTPHTLTMQGPATEVYRGVITLPNISANLG